MANIELIIAVSVFCTSLLFIIFDWVDKTIVALTGAIILILTGVLSWEAAINSIDFETLALLIGLMLLVIIAQHSGIFSWINVKIAEKTQGNPIWVYLSFILLTFLTSTILNNATVMLLVIPIAIAMCKGLALNSKLLVILLAIFSNIGGALTLIGDPPNTIIGVQANIPFNSFIENLFFPIISMTIIIIGYVLATNWEYLKPHNTNLAKVFTTSLTIKRIKYQFANFTLDKVFITKTISVIIFSVLAFVLQPKLGISVGTIGMASGLALALLVFNKIDFAEIIKEVEWDSILFFTGLFIQVGALEHVGFLKLIAEQIINFDGSYTALLLIILWVVAISSAIIDNIPFVVLMIPIIMDIQEKLVNVTNPELLWWALALGACLGGNGTILGSSAGLISVGLAKKQNIHISFIDFMKVSVPITIISLVVSSIYLVIASN